MMTRLLPSVKAEEEVLVKVNSDLCNLNDLNTQYVKILDRFDLSYVIKIMSFENEPKSIEDYKDVVKILKLKIIKQNKKIQ